MAREPPGDTEPSADTEPSGDGKPSGDGEPRFGAVGRAGRTGRPGVVMTGSPLAEAVHAAARLAPGHVAVVHPGSGQFAELTAASGTARTALDRLGLPAGQPIAVRAAKSPQTVALILACFAAARPVLLLSVDLGAQVAGSLVQRAGCAGVAAATGDGFDWSPAPVPAGAPDLPPAPP